MKPPQTLNVIDRHGGFTIESKPPYWWKGKRLDFSARRREGESRGAPPKRLRSLIGDSLWRPGQALRRGTRGELIAFDENAFYQTNDNVTLAVYHVPGYGYPVLVWFDNDTRERIA